MRLWLASRGHNYDMDAWHHIAAVARDNWNVYAATHRYNYGPVWFFILGALHRLHDALPLSSFGAESFHLVVALFLSAVDVGIALLLFRSFGLAASLFFILNPVSILLTGYHSQFDNLAVLPALGAWLLIRSEPSLDTVRWARLVGGAGLLGLSLTIKHFMFAFPLWILFCPFVIGGLGRRAMLALLAYAIFVGSFIPFLFTPGAAQSIFDNVVNYATVSATALLPSIIDMLVPLRAIDSCFGFAPNFSVVKWIFPVLLIATGWLFARHVPEKLLVCYLGAVLVLTSVINDQYLAIPLVACAIEWRRPSAWLYTALAAALVEQAAYHAGVISGPPWWRNHLPGLLPRHAIVWLAVMLVMILLRSRRGSMIWKQ